MPDLVPSDRQDDLFQLLQGLKRTRDAIDRKIEEVQEKLRGKIDEANQRLIAMMTDDMED